VELLVLIVGVAVVYYVVTHVSSWWRGFRQRHRAAPLILIALVLAVVWMSQSSTATGVADVAVSVMLAFGLLAAVVLAVAGSRRRRAQQASAEAQLQRRRRTSRQPKRVYDSRGREQYVYAAGSFDKRTQALTHVKIGHTSRPKGVREAEVQQDEAQVPRTHEIRTLARGPGGERREQDLHRRLDAWRYPASEWFEPSPEVLAAVAELEWPTDEGMEVTGARTA
jgi:hypothetical protein